MSPRHNLSSNSILKQNLKIRSSYDCNRSEWLQSFVNLKVWIRCQGAVTFEQVHSASFKFPISIEIKTNVILSPNQTSLGKLQQNHSQLLLPVKQHFHRATTQLMFRKFNQLSVSKCNLVESVC